MAESDFSNALGARLRRLPRDLLLALVNATAVLVLLAALAALWLVDRLQTAVADTAASATAAVLGTAGLDAAATLSELRDLNREVAALRTRLDRNEAGTPDSSDAAALSAQLQQIEAALQQLVDARGYITDRAIDRVGQHVTASVAALRRCPALAGAPDSRSRPSFPQVELDADTRRAVAALCSIPSLSPASTDQPGEHGEQGEDVSPGLPTPTN